MLEYRANLVLVDRSLFILYWPSFIKASCQLIGSKSIRERDDGRFLKRKLGRDGKRQTEKNTKEENA